MPLFTFGAWFLGALLSFTSVVLSRDADPTEDFCSLSAHMMAQKDGILYIAGGWMQYSTVYGGYDGPNTVLRSLNVSKSFQTSVDSANYIRMEQIPTTVPGFSNAAFFPTESGFDLTFGEWQPYNSTIYGKKDAPTEDKKWQYEITARRWTDVGMTRNNWFQTDTSRRISSSMIAWIPSLKKGFLFGGTFLSINGTSLKVTDLEEHNGLITYDQATNTWTNETTPLGGISEGSLVHITTATDEVLIQFGGRSEWATRLREFSKINIYSTNRSKWYTQYLPPEAPVPAPRFAFCAALKSAPDGSSHQIYIMGGLEARNSVDAKGGPTAASVWVLSIPSFEWAQLQVASKTTPADPRGRISPKCQAIGEHYIFYYGGRNALGYYNTITCDKKANVAFLFDVNTLTWTDEFTPNEGTYEIPPKIIALIGGHKSGGSTKKAPTKGWSDPDLATIMAPKTITTAGSSGGSANTSSNGGTSSSNGSGSSSGSSKTNVGAIAGGAVGGVVAIALGMWGAIILRRRRRKAKPKHPLVNGGNAHPVESPVELPAGDIH